MPKSKYLRNLPENQPTSSKCHRSLKKKHRGSRQPYHLPSPGSPHRSHVVGIVGLQWHATAAAADHVLQGFARLRHDILGCQMDGGGRDPGMVWGKHEEDDDEDPP